MRILYVSHRIPYPPDKGDKIRAYHQLRHLAARHDVHLYTLVDDERDWRQLPVLERMCASVTAFPLRARDARLRAACALATGRPFSPAYFRQPELIAAVRRDLQAIPFDAAIVFCSAMMDTLPGDAPDLPVIADYCDLDSAKWAAYARDSRMPSSLVWAAEARRLARYEVTKARACRTVVFATPLEADDFAGLPRAAEIPVRVIANGVDHDVFRRGDAERAAEPTVIFTGAMDYRPNHEGALWFLDRVWTRVLEEIPEARMQVVGRDPFPELRARDGRDRIEVTGAVPEIRPWLHGAWLSVAPLRIARGVQNKVLEAMSAGVPTLISPAVSRGLEARNGVETLVVDGEEDWVASVVRLLRSHRLRAGLAEAGLRYVRARHDWNAHGAAWESLLDRAVDGKRRGVA